MGHKSEKRLLVPDFYGYVPANPIKRMIVFASMLFFSAGMLLIRCMTIVILSLVSRKWAFIYIAADHFFYLAFKLLREASGIGFQQEVSLKYFRVS